MLPSPPDAPAEAHETAARAEPEQPTPGPGAPQPKPGHQLRDYGSWPMVVLLLSAAVFLSGFVAVPVVRALVAPGAGSTEELAREPLAFFVFIALEDLAFLLIVYLALFRPGVMSLREMGLGRLSSRSVVHGLGWGLLFLVVSAVVSTVLAAFGVEQNQAQQFPLEGTGTAGRVAVLLAGGLLAPFAEEVFFRGYVFRAMAARKGLARGVIYSSLLFGIVHLNLAAFLPISLGAVLLALAYHRSRDLWTAIVAHAVNNIFAFTVLFFGMSQ
jgi:hypothetical protein